MEHLMAAEVEGRPAPLVLDPALVSELGQPASASLLHAVSVAAAERTELELPIESQRDVANLQEWIAELGPDEMRAMEPLWQGCLGKEQPSLGTADFNWATPWPGPGAAALARHIARRALAGSRAVRVITSREFLVGAEPDGVLALDVRMVGRIQVKPEMLEYAA